MFSGCNRFLFHNSCRCVLPVQEAFPPRNESRAGDVRAQSFCGPRRPRARQGRPQVHVLSYRFFHRRSRSWFVWHILYHASNVDIPKAYLTNPSENSFRAYLTEQSFRHHLSRLDDNADDNQSSNHLRSPTSSKTTLTSPSHTFSASNNPPFHFANRASISLRTPKHVFHSFAVFTIAAMVPLSKNSDGVTRDGWIISDSWYIGAFGKWWRGGVFEEWYQDVIARAKDEESWSSGIISMKRLDMLQDYHGMYCFSSRRARVIC